MDQTSGPLARQAGLSAFILVLASVLGVVLDRVGVAPSLLVTLALVLVLAVGTVTGTLAGTMRLPLYLTGGGDLPVAAVGLIVAVIVAGEGRLQPVPAMATLAIWAVVLAPALRRTGVPGLAGALGHAFASPALRALLAPLAGGTALVFATGHVADVAALLGPLLALGPTAATTLTVAVLAIVLVPGGLRGATRMAIGLGLVAVLAALCVVAAGVAGGGLTLARIADAAAPAAGAGWQQAFAMAALACTPHLALVAPAGRSDGAVREGGLWGALTAMALTTAALIAPEPGKVPSGIDVLLPMAQAGARLAVDLAAAALLLQAAGAAFGYELPGHLDRRRHPMSKRFARLRLTTLLCIVAAAWLSLARGADVVQAAPIAAALLVGGVGPALALAALARAPGRWGGLVGTVVGLATTTTLLAGGATAPWLPEPAGFAGLLAGLVAGLPPAVLTRRPATLDPVEDGAL